MPPAYLTQPPGVRFRQPPVGCYGKQAFESATEAHKAISRKAKTSGNRAPMKSYRCLVCGTWHLCAAQPDAAKKFEGQNLVRAEPK